MSEPIPYASAGPERRPLLSRRMRRRVLPVLGATLVLFAALGWWAFDDSVHRFQVIVEITNDCDLPVQRVDFALDKTTWSAGAVARGGGPTREVLRLKGRGPLTFSAVLADGTRVAGSAATYLDDRAQGQRISVHISRTTQGLPNATH